LHNTDDLVPRGETEDVWRASNAFEEMSVPYDVKSGFVRELQADVGIVEA
jgi:hypothetical protein